MTPCRLLLLAGLGILGFSSADAQTVYRCGPNANQYSQHPCENGKVLDVSDARSDEQLKAAQDSIKAQQRLGRNMAKERRADERANPPPAAGNVGPPQRLADSSGLAGKSKRSKSAEKSGKSKVRRPESQEFAAIEPGSPNRKRAKKLQD